MWLPKVERTAHGWRITSPIGGVQSGPAIAGDHLAWISSGFLTALDLHTGRTTVLAAPAERCSINEFSLSDEFVAWTLNRSNGTSAHYARSLRSGSAFMLEDAGSDA